MGNDDGMSDSSISKTTKSTGKKLNMVRRKDSFWKHAKKTEDGRSFICEFCKKRFAGGISRIKSHLSGVIGRDIQICQQVPEEIQLKAKQALLKFDVVIDTPTKRANTIAIDTPIKRGKNVATSDNVLESENISGEGQDKSTGNQELAKFLMLNKICPSAIKSPFFIDFVKCVAEHGPGYELPSFFTLKSQLMPNVKKEVEEYVQNVIKCSGKTGCTFMYNLHPQNDALVFIFAYTPIGVACIRSFSCYTDIENKGSFISSTKSTDILFEQAKSSIIQLIGPANVVQFIISDNIYEANSTTDIFCSKYPWIYQSRCATHGISLLFEKISNLSFVSNTIEAANLIVTYINKHKVNVPLRRVLRTNSSAKLKVFKLISLLEVESELQALQVSIATLSCDQGKPCNYKQAAKNYKDAIFIDSIIHCKGFWSRGKMVAQLMQPLLQACYLVHGYHGYGPTSGYLYEMMERIQDAFEQFRDSNHVRYDDMCKILKEVRSDIISPIHEVAAFLNPIYMYSEKFKETDEMKNGVNHILKYLVAVEETEDFVSQVGRYRMKDSTIFTANAMLLLKTCHPRIWWESCGNDIPVLQKFAIRILSQPCSTSLVREQRYELDERHGKEQTFMLNAMMMERCKSIQAQMTEPIIFDQLGLDQLSAACDNVDNLGYGNQHIPHVTDRFIVVIQNDPTGSWVDLLPNELTEECNELTEEWNIDSMESKWIESYGLSNSNSCSDGY